MTANRRQFLHALGCAALVRTARPQTAPPSAPLDESLASLGTTACQVIHRGRLVFTHGDPARLSYLASARKSLVSMVYGPAVSRGEIDLDATLRSIGFDDLGGLLPIERSATLRHLLMARSGIYHPAANRGDASDRAPPRGSVTPGSYFLYNNWDFNALGALYEKLTGRGLYQGFELDIARPIGLQDWDATVQPVRNDTGASSHPAQHFVLSTRDMARLGALMLAHGRHGRRTVLSGRWVGLTTRTSTPAAEVARTSPFIAGLGYGYLWWTFDDAPRWGRAMTGAFTASGAFGQFITVIPRLEMVIAHKTQAPDGGNVRAEDYFGRVVPAAAALARRPSVRKA